MANTRYIDAQRTTKRNPELLLVAELLEAVVRQLQNNREAANDLIAAAWERYDKARSKGRGSNPSLSPFSKGG